MTDTTRDPVTVDRQIYDDLVRSVERCRQYRLSVQQSAEEIVSATQGFATGETNGGFLPELVITDAEDARLVADALEHYRAHLTARIQRTTSGSDMATLRDTRYRVANLCTLAAQEALTST